MAQLGEKIYIRNEKKDITTGCSCSIPKCFMQVKSAIKVNITVYLLFKFNSSLELSR